MNDYKTKLEQRADNILDDLIEGCFRQFRTDNYTPEDGRIAKSRLLELITEARIDLLDELRERASNNHQLRALTLLDNYAEFEGEDK